MRREQGLKAHPNHFACIDLGLHAVFDHRLSLRPLRKVINKGDDVPAQLLAED